jgi:hypothetical protein
VLNGANAVAIGDGSGSNWEVFQFVQAELVAPDTYELSTRLRGQLGTDGIVPSVWPAGSTVVALDLALTQVDLSLSARGLARYYRIGMASRGYDDVNVVKRVEAFDGIGLRPYPVAHLKYSVIAGDLGVEWQRRTRVDGDSWQSSEVPLAEDAEAYRVRIIQNDAVVAEYTTAVPSFTYTSGMRTSDAVSGAFQIQVAQVSVAFGPGPFRQIAVTI